MQRSVSIIIGILFLVVVGAASHGRPLRAPHGHRAGRHGGARLRRSAGRLRRARRGHRRASRSCRSARSGRSAADARCSSTGRPTTPISSRWPARPARLKMRTRSIRRCGCSPPTRCIASRSAGRRIGRRCSRISTPPSAPTTRRCARASRGRTWRSTTSWPCGCATRVGAGKRKVLTNAKTDDTESDPNMHGDPGEPPKDMKVEQFQIRIPMDPKEIKQSQEQAAGTGAARRKRG